MYLGTGASDNYAYLIIDDKTQDAMIVDPANPPEYVSCPLNPLIYFPGRKQEGKKKRKNIGH